MRQCLGVAGYDTLLSRIHCDFCKHTLAILVLVEQLNFYVGTKEVKNIIKLSRMMNKKDRRRKKRR